MPNTVTTEIVRVGDKWRVEVYRGWRRILTQEFATEEAARAFAAAQEWAANGEVAE